MMTVTAEATFKNVRDAADFGPRVFEPPADFRRVVHRENDVAGDGGSDRDAAFAYGLGDERVDSAWMAYDEEAALQAAIAASLGEACGGHAATLGTVADDPREWECEACTFKNKPQFLCCEICRKQKSVDRTPVPAAQTVPSALGAFDADLQLALQLSLAQN